MSGSNTAMTDDDLFGAAPAPDTHTPSAQSGGVTVYMGKQTPPPLPATSDADLIARAAVAEGDPNNPQSWQNIAGVIHNRMAASGMTASQVLSQPGQFESYANGHMQAVDPAAPAYQAASQAIAPVLSGAMKVPYDSFYNPTIVAQRGSTPPFAPSAGTTIGTQLFGTTTPGSLSPVEQAQWESLAGGASGAPPTTIATAPLPPVGQPALPPGVNYDAGHALLNGTALGFGNRMLAGVQAGKAEIGDLMNGAPIQNAMTGFGNYYDQAKTAYDQAQKSYATAHPIANGVATAVGNTASLIPLMAVGGEALAPVRAAMGPVGDFLAGEAGGSGSLGNRLVGLASRGAQGALAGGAGGVLTGAQDNRPLAEDAATGALGGAVLGSTVVPALGAAGRTAADIVAGLKGIHSDVTPEVAALADKAVNQYGIPLRSSQIRGVANPSMAIADSERLSVPGTGYGDNQAEQKAAFTKAVANTFGSNAEKLTPEAMQTAKTRIGGVFDRVANNTTIADTDPLLDRLGSIVHDAQQVLPDSQAAPLLKQVENIGSTIKDGQMSGSSYQALTQKGSPLDIAQNGPDLSMRHYAGQIRDALDDALEAHASPTDLADLQNARWQYKNLMTVKNLAAKAGVNGEISPALLNGAVNTSFKNRAFSGAGDLGELAQIGQTFMKEPANSQTAARAAYRVGSSLKPLVMGAAGAGDLAAMIHDPAHAMAIAGGTALAGAGLGAAKYGADAITGAYNLSPGIRSRLLDGALNPAPAFNPFARVVNDNAPLAGSLLLNRLVAPNTQVGQ